jgi:subtilisin family serine protease
MAEIIHTVAPDARIIPIRARSSERREYEQYLIAGLYYAADHGAVAVTSSMGPLTQSTQLDSAIAYAEAHGTVFVNVHPETIRVPGTKPRLCDSGECDSRILHTGIVSVPDYEVEPESNRDIYTWAYDLEAHYEDGWGYSNAPPTVAGVIALMKEVCPSLSPEEVRQIVRETTYDYDGFRCLDAEAAVKAAMAEIDSR